MDEICKKILFFIMLNVFAIFDPKFQNMGSLGDNFCDFLSETQKKKNNNNNNKTKKKKHGIFGWQSIILRGLWGRSELKERVFLTYLLNIWECSLPPGSVLHILSQFWFCNWFEIHNVRALVAYSSQTFAKDK